MNPSPPVLLIAFNRPDRFARLIDAVRAARPEHVYVAIDGPRNSNSADAAGVQACRDLIARIDWTSSVHVLARPENLGCGRAVSGAIDWFFEHETRGIILEDDLIPQESFFGFCAQLLEHYEDVPDVFAISGCNVVPADHISSGGPYRFTQIPQIWGWATWRRTWQEYHLDITGWRSGLPWGQRWQVMGRSLMGVAYWSALFDLLASGQIDTWDGQLVYAAMRTRGLTAIANVNLVANEGFGSDATHTVREPDFLQPAQPIDLALLSVSIAGGGIPVATDHRADRWMRVVAYQATWWGLARQAARYVSRRRAQATSTRGVRG